MSGVRRSGRISKQVPILLLGTDTSGRVFAEETRTLVLSRHGAGILSRYKLAPDEVLTLRRVGFTPEAEARLVGRIGQQGDAYVYGVEFSDPAVNFWQVDFPAPSSAGDGKAGGILECASCGAREAVQQSDIEADVYAVNDSILRFCQRCGISTNWRSARPGAEASPGQPAVAPPSAAPEPVLATVDSKGERSTVAAGETETALQPLAGAVTAAAVLDPVPKGRVAAKGGHGSGAANRRRHVRTAVRFTACVRDFASGEEIVECDNISKGGASFRSRKRYVKDAFIEIAVPYSPGAPAIFVYAGIRHVAELPGKMFRYGVEYVKSTDLKFHS